MHSAARMPWSLGASDMIEHRASCLEGMYLTALLLPRPNFFTSILRLQPVSSFKM